MIIRIMGGRQYHVPEELCDQLREIDNRIVALIEEGNEMEFRKELFKLISEIIVPPENMSFKEVKDVFKESKI